MYLRHFLLGTKWSSWIWKKNTTY